METRETTIDWGSLAPDLLALVLQKVREGAGARGEGRRVVAIAGVCRAWRRFVHRELHCREAPSLVIAFPAETQQPAPSHLQCLLKKTGSTFRLVQVVAGEEFFLLGARKKYSIGSSFFRISTDPRVLWTQGDGDAVSVASNFWRTAFFLEEWKATMSLRYDEVAFDGNCLRRMRCEKRTRLEERALSPWWLSAVVNLLQSFNRSGKVLMKNCDRMFSLRNKDPDWHEQKQCWSLDFKGRGAIIPSIHNFQLVSCEDCGDGRVILQLGKLCRGLFVLDFGPPLSALEAIAIALSSFVTSVGLDS